MTIVDVVKMCTRTLSTRVEKEVEEEVAMVMQVEKIDKATAVRKLLKMGVKEWRLELALELLTEEKVTVWKAAEIAKIPLWDIVDVIKQRKITLPIAAEDIIEDIRTALREGKK